MTSIGDFAFENCSGLTSIEIPNSVTGIGYSAFMDCSGLTSVAFAENSQLTSIVKSTFSRCTGLTSITIPESVIFIEEDAFDGCNSLTDFYYDGTYARWNAIAKYCFEYGRIYTVHCTDGDFEPTYKLGE